MMFRSTFDDVVSVASPGSSDGGSAPQAIVIVCLAASDPPPPEPPLELLLLPPPQPAATSAATATRRAASAIELRVRISRVIPSSYGRTGRRPSCLTLLPGPVRVATWENPHLGRESPVFSDSLQGVARSPRMGTMEACPCSGAPFRSTLR